MPDFSRRRRRSARTLVAIFSCEPRNSLKDLNPQTIMSRRMRRDQRSPSISTEAFKGQGERRWTRGFFLATLKI